jgi:hypothetical protein
MTKAKVAKAFITIFAANKSTDKVCKEQLVLFEVRGLLRGKTNDYEIRKTHWF